MNEIVDGPIGAPPDEVLLANPLAQPLAEEAIAELPVAEAPVAEAPVAELPVAELPVAEPPAVGIPAADIPAADIPAADIPAADIPAADIPAVDIPVAELPVAELPVAEAPAAKLPAVDIPVAELPAVDIPVAELPAVDIPVAELPAVDIPVAELPAVDIPVAELPVAELPAMDIPVAELPVAELPVAELPVAEAPVTELPAVEIPVAELPAAQAAPPVDPGRARAQAKWDRLVAAKAAGEIVQGRVKTAVKGGLIVAIEDFRAFLPASQTQLAKDATLESLVKATLPLKIIDVDEKRRRFVVSHRKALESQRRAGHAEFLASLAVGDERDVTVARLTDFGAFVELGFGVDALLPMSELAIERVNRAEDVLKVGEILKVRVLRVEERGKRISVSRKALLHDPWRERASELRTGATVQGTVVAIDDRLTVEIAPGITGTLSDRDANPDDYTIGEAIEVIIRSIDPRTRRVRLSTPHNAAASVASSLSSSSSGFAPLGVELKR